MLYKYLCSYFKTIKKTFSQHWNPIWLDMLVNVNTTLHNWEIYLHRTMLLRHYTETNVKQAAPSQIAWAPEPDKMHLIQLLPLILSIIFCLLVPVIFPHLFRCLSLSHSVIPVSMRGGHPWLASQLFLINVYATHHWVANKNRRTTTLNQQQRCSLSDRITTDPAVWRAERNTPGKFNYPPTQHWHSERFQYNQHQTHKGGNQHNSQQHTGLTT